MCVYVCVCVHVRMVYVCYVCVVCVCTCMVYVCMHVMCVLCVCTFMWCACGVYVYDMWYGSMSVFFLGTIRQAYMW